MAQPKRITNAMLARATAAIDDLTDKMTAAGLAVGDTYYDELVAFKTDLIAIPTRAVVEHVTLINDLHRRALDIERNALTSTHSAQREADELVAAIYELANHFKPTSLRKIAIVGSVIVIIIGLLLFGMWKFMNWLKDKDEAGPESVSVSTKGLSPDGKAIVEAVLTDGARTRAQNKEQSDRLEAKLDIIGEGVTATREAIDPEQMARAMLKAPRSGDEETKTMPDGGDDDPITTLVDDYCKKAEAVEADRAAILEELQAAKKRNRLAMARSVKALGDRANIIDDAIRAIGGEKPTAAPAPALKDGELPQQPLSGPNLEEAIKRAKGEPKTPTDTGRARIR